MRKSKSRLGLGPHKCRKTRCPLQKVLVAHEFSFNQEWWIYDHLWGGVGTSLVENNVTIFLWNKCIFKCSCKMCLLFLHSADNMGKGKKYLYFPETSVLNCFSHPVHGWESNREFSDCESGKGRSYFELLFKCLFAQMCTGGQHQVTEGLCEGARSWHLYTEMYFIS